MTKEELRKRQSEAGKKRFRGMTKEERSEYARKIHYSDASLGGYTVEQLKAELKRRKAIDKTSRKVYNG